MSRLEPARRHELLAHLLERLRLDWERPLDAVAERRRNPVEVADEPAHPVRHQRERVVGALPGVVEREVLLDHARAEHVAEQRHRVAVLVVGEPDHDLRIPLAQRRDHAQVQLLHLDRIRRRALQHAELRVEREDRLHRTVDVLERGAAGGEDDRLAVRGDVPEQRRVHDVR